MSEVYADSVLVDRNEFADHAVFESRKPKTGHKHNRIESKFNAIEEGTAVD